MKRWIKGSKEELFFTWDMDGYFDFSVHCPHCNEEVHNENYEVWKYCPYCGKRVKEMLEEEE